MIKKYPLTWPAGWKRTLPPNRKWGRFVSAGTVTGQFSRTDKKRISVGTAIERIFEELRRMDVPNGEALISSNLELNAWGIPRGDRAEPTDPGVAVYWEARGKPQCMAIDVYHRVADNLAAVAASLEALRAIERHGGAAIMERAFIGFAALSERATPRRPWRDILHFADTSEVKSAHVEARYRELAKTAHSDKAGGSNDAMIELNAAREDALRELGQ
jgi:hypothetical protein